MKRLAVVAAALMVVACTTPAKNTSQSGSGSGSAAAGSSTATVPNGGADVGKLNGGEQAGKSQSVYFDYAKATITPEYQAVIQKQAEAIKDNKKELVTLEGNCDERGSAEYNLGLGQRRADAVKKLMVVAGVHASQLKTVSLGKEKPKANCHDESCWKENRRVDFVQGS